MKRDSDAVPQGRLKIDRLGTGRGRSAPQQEERPAKRGCPDPSHQRAPRRGESPPDDGR